LATEVPPNFITRRAMTDPKPENVSRKRLARPPSRAYKGASGGGQRLELGDSSWPPPPA